MEISGLLLREVVDFFEVAVENQIIEPEYNVLYLYKEADGGNCRDLG